MRETDPPVGGKTRPFTWLLCAVAFLIAYGVMVAELDLFQVRNPFYVVEYCRYDLWKDLAGSSMRYFDPQQLSSMVWKVVLLLPATLFLAMAVTQYYGARLDRRIESLFQFMRKRYALLPLMIFSVLIIVLLVVFAFKARPIVDDELAYLFQAKTYLTGHLTAPMPPAPTAIARAFMILNVTNDVWSTKYLWGHPAFLAIGMALGSANITGVGMALVSLLLLYVVGTQVYDRRIAILAAALMAFSPWFLFTSATYLSHITMLPVLLLFTVGWFRLERNPGFLLGIALGFALAWSFTIRPLTAILYGVPFGFLGAVNLYRDQKRWPAAVLGLLVGALLVGAMLWYYDELVTGDATLLPWNMYQAGEKYGFGWITPSGIFHPIYFHTLGKGIANLAVSALRIDAWFLGWPISLLPLMVFCVITIWSRSLPAAESREWTRFVWSRADKIWVAVISCHFVGHILYYSPGIGETGPFYYYELLTPICLLSARGLSFLHELIRMPGYQQWRRFIAVFCGLSSLFSLILFLPEKAIHIRRVYDVAHEPFEYAEANIGEKAIVFVGFRQLTGWQVCLPYPSPKLDDKVIYVQFKGPKADRLAGEAFKDRSVYLLYYNAQKKSYVLTKMPRQNPYTALHRELDQERQRRYLGSAPR